MQRAVVEASPKTALKCIDICPSHMCTHWIHFSDMGKDAGFRIRVERDLRDEFVDACRAHDRPAAQVIRDFMRQYIKDNASANNQREDD